VHFTKTDSLAVGDTLAIADIFGTSGVGRLAISRDGTLLAVITDNGFSLVKTGISRRVTFSALSAHAHIKLGRGKAKIDMFTVYGSFALGSGSIQSTRTSRLRSELPRSISRPDRSGGTGVYSSLKGAPAVWR